MHVVSNTIDALEQKDFRLHAACSPGHRHSLCLHSLHQSRSFLSLLSGSFLVAWVRKMSANHCLGLVMVSPPANSWRMLFQHQFHPACWNLSFAIFSLIAVLCFLISHRKALLLYASEKHHGASSCLPFADRVTPTFVKRHPFSHTRACERRVLCTVLMPPNCTCTIVGVSECSSQESSFGDQCISPLSTGCHLTGSLVISLSSSLVHHMRQCVVVYSRSSTPKGAPSEITATMVSSHHELFSPRVQLDIHLPQTSM